MTDPDNERHEQIAQFADQAATAAEQMQPAIGLVTTFLINSSPAEKVEYMRTVIAGKGSLEGLVAANTELIWGLAHLASQLAVQLAEERGVQPQEILQQMGAFAARSEEMRDFARRLREGWRPDDDPGPET